MDKPQISCIILAGGEGKRFNREDKGLIKLDHKPLVEHIIECIRPQVDDIVISANRNFDTYKSFSQTVIKDNNKSVHGPLAGVASCLTACKHEWILIIPCDTPILPDNLVSSLSTTSDHRLVVAKSNQQRQLVFLMHITLKESLNEYLQQGHQKAMAWIELQNPKVVTFSSTNNAFTNVNTPQDLSAL